jgi:hypothetical protein
MNQIQPLEFGDVDGHPFHGNQWTGGRGGDGKDGVAEHSDEGFAGTRDLRNAMAKGLSPRGDTGKESALLDATDEMRGRAKDEIVKAAGADIAKAAISDPEVHAEMDRAYEDRTALTRDWEDRQRGDWTDEELAAKSNEQLYGEIKAQDYVDTWANSAADNDVLSLSLQATTANLLDAHSASFDSYVKEIGGPTNAFGLDMQDLMAQDGNTMKAFVQGEYDRTQSMLKDNGIDEVTLYRGFSSNTPYPEAGPQSIEMNPASSWTVDHETGTQFAYNEQGTGGGQNHYLLQMTVPASDIISTARTGQGALIEGEVLVRNQPGAVANVTGVSLLSDAGGAVAQ